MPMDDCMQKKSVPAPLESAMRPKVTILGAGNTGTATATWLAARDLCDIVLLDIVPGLAKGKAFDLQEAMPILGQSTRITGADDYSATAGSEVVVITAGSPRKPGMTREDLLQVNASVVVEAVEQSLKHSPQAILILLTNPVDVLSYLAFRVSGLPKNRVIGQGGLLDTARYRMLLAQELGVSVESVCALILGEHGDSMIPLPRHSTAHGVPLSELLSAEKLDNLAERTRHRGTEIVNLLKTGSAALAAGAALMTMIESILGDTHRVLPCSAYCEGEFGIQALFLGVPAVIGRDGVERIIELPLNPEEKSALEQSAEKIRKIIAQLPPFSRK
jgi:malate dehydrogenase